MNLRTAHSKSHWAQAWLQAGVDNTTLLIESLPKMFPYCSHAESNNGRGNLERSEIPENSQTTPPVNQSFINHVTMKVGL